MTALYFIWIYLLGNLLLASGNTTQSESLNCPDNGKYIVKVKPTAAKSMPTNFKKVANDSNYFVTSNTNKSSLQQNRNILEIQNDCIHKLDVQGFQSTGTPKKSSEDPLNKYLWGLKEIDAWSTASTLTSSPVTIGVCDTGASPNHEDLLNTYKLNQDGTPAIFDTSNLYGNLGQENPLDEHYHGTHVTGTIAASAGNLTGMAGIAPNLKIVSGRVFDANGSGWASSIAACINKMVNEYKVDILNLSLGGPSPDIIRQELRNAVEKNTLVVIAAGNSARRVETDWFADTNIGIVVGALEPRMNNQTLTTVEELEQVTTNFTAASTSVGYAEYSNFGPQVDILAPGSFVVSTVLNNQYAALSGTSMAAPHVSAVAGLIKSKNRDLSAMEIKHILVESGVSFHSTTENRTYPKLNLTAALSHPYTQRNPVTFPNLRGEVLGKYFNSETQTLQIYGWVSDPDYRKVPLVFEIQNSSEKNSFYRFSFFQSDVCERFGPDIQSHPTSLKNYTGQINNTSHTFCIFEATIDLSQFRGNLSYRIQALDRDRFGGRTWNELQDARGTVNMRSPATNTPVIGQVTNVERIHRRIMLIEGVIHEPDSNTTWVQLLERPFGCSTCSFYPADQMLADETGNFQFTGRIDENYFRDRTEFVVQVFDRDSNGSYLGSQMIPYQNNSPTIDGNFVNTPQKWYKSLEEQCEIKTYNHTNEYAIDFHLGFFPNATHRYTMIAHKNSSYAYLENGTVEYGYNTSSCGRNYGSNVNLFMANILSLPNAGFDMSCGSELQIRTDMNDNLDLTRVDVIDPRTGQIIKSCKNLQLYLQTDHFD